MTSRTTSGARSNSRHVTTHAAQWMDNASCSLFDTVADRYTPWNEAGALDIYNKMVTPGGSSSLRYQIEIGLFASSNGRAAAKDRFLRDHVERDARRLAALPPVPCTDPDPSALVVA